VSTGPVYIFESVIWYLVCVDTSGGNELDALKVELTGIELVGTIDEAVGTEVVGTIIDDAFGTEVVGTSTDEAVGIETVGTTDVVVGIETVGTTDVVVGIETVGTTDVVVGIETVGTTDVVVSGRATLVVGIKLDAITFDD
jgi:hypothetical protein